MLEAAVSVRNLGDNDLVNTKKNGRESQNSGDINSLSTEEDIDEIEDRYAVATPPSFSSIPSVFESVSVVNSNDVHFGNKTIYQGPVTIKKFIYKDRNSDADGSVIGENTEDIIKITRGGVYNGAFEKDEAAASQNNDSVDRTLDVPVNKNEEDSEDNAVLKFCTQIKEQRLKMVLIFFSMLIVCLVVVSFSIPWVFRTTNAITLPNAGQNKDDVEEDHHTPVNYSSDSKDTFGPKVRIFSRIEWLAQPPENEINLLKLPVSLIIIQHSSTEGCDSQAKCILQTRLIQTFHIESRGWYDIAYNFLLGGDGNAYEGRGWKLEGAHTYGYNNISLGFGFIGTFNTELPSPRQLYAFHKLVETGVRLGYITTEYKIMAARQLYGTESPGKRFFEEIRTWKHWSNKYK